MLKAKSRTTQRLHIVVSGTVQGIGYRWFVQKTADRLGVTGWVRNLTDGNVEIEAEHSPEVLQLFMQKLRNEHPWASVSDITAVPLPAASESSTQFRIIN